MNKCDHTSVGALIYNGYGQLLMFERNTPPYGIAGPAGHCDGDSYVDALKKEVWEEVGLEVVEWSSKLVTSFCINRACRRPYEGEAGHEWQFYLTTTTHLDLNPSVRETKNVDWYSPLEIKQLMRRTEEYHLYGTISDEEWYEQPGLDISWYRLFASVPKLL